MTLCHGAHYSLQVNAGSQCTGVGSAGLLLHRWTHSASDGGGLQHAEALATLTDGQLQHLVQFLIGVVGREAQLVKTRKKVNHRVRSSLHV